MVTIMAVVFLLGMVLQGKEINRLKNINQTNNARMEIVRLDKNRCSDLLALTEHKQGLCANDLTVCKASESRLKDELELCQNIK